MKSRDVVAVVLRGSGGTLTAGYDLTAGTGSGCAVELRGGLATLYGAKGPEPREGTWDPVGDYQFMGNNARGS